VTAGEEAALGAVALEQGQGVLDRRRPFVLDWCRYLHPIPLLDVTERLPVVPWCRGRAGLVARLKWVTVALSGSWVNGEISEALSGCSREPVVGVPWPAMW